MAKAPLSQTRAPASPSRASTRGRAAPRGSRSTGTPPTNQAPGASSFPSTVNETPRCHLRHHGEERTRVESATEQQQPMSGEGVFAGLEISRDVYDETIDEAVPVGIANCNDTRPMLQPRCSLHRFLGIRE